MIWITLPLIWSQGTVDKIFEKHQLCPEEVEEAIIDDDACCHKCGSNSYCVYGQSLSGRYIFTVIRRKGKGSQFKVITARDMQEKEKRYYEKHKSK